jgi:hypothetical protein
VSLSLSLLPTFVDDVVNLTAEPSIVPYERGTQIPTLAMTSSSYHPFSQERSHEPTPAAESNNDTQIPSIDVNSNYISTLPSIDQSCIDDLDYRSPANEKFGCEIYCGTNCTTWGLILNSTQLNEVFSRCPLTCNDTCR